MATTVTAIARGCRRAWSLTPGETVITLGTILDRADTRVTGRLNKRVLVVLGLTLVYAAVCAPTFDALGYSAGILSIAPALAAAWFWGARIGALAALMTFPLNSVMAAVTLGADWSGFISRGAPLGTAATVLVAFLIGRLRDLEARARETEKERMERTAAEALRRSRERMVVAAEAIRREIAQNIHGSIQTKLIVLVHRLRELAGAAPKGPAADELNDLQKVVSELIEREISAISRQLYPSILRRGLVPALQSLGDQFLPAVDVETDLDEQLIRLERSNSRLIPEEVRLAAYRIAENALNNVLKHAEARKVSVVLEMRPEQWLHLSVHDDGRGFDVNGSSSGQGLGTMRDYAEVAGGACVITSAAGEGTEVSADLPLVRAESNGALMLGDRDLTSPES